MKDGKVVVKYAQKEIGDYVLLDKPVSASHWITVKGQRLYIN